MISKDVIHHLLHLIVKAFLIRQVQYVITVGFQAKKTNCGSACPLSIYDNEIGYGRPWSKYIWESNCLMTYILYFPYSGEPHPACKAGLITCTSQVSGNQVTFTANSTQTGGIGEIGAEATYRKWERLQPRRKTEVGAKAPPTEPILRPQKPLLSEKSEGGSAQG
jgi:hypothetical protein